MALLHALYGVAVPVDTLIDTLAVLYTHQHAQYTLLDISVCCAVRIATLGVITTAESNNQLG